MICPQKINKKKCIVSWYVPSYEKKISNTYCCIVRHWLDCCQWNKYKAGTLRVHKIWFHQSFRNWFKHHLFLFCHLFYFSLMCTSFLELNVVYTYIKIKCVYKWRRNFRTKCASMVKSETIFLQYLRSNRWYKIFNKHNRSFKCCMFILMTKHNIDSEMLSWRRWNQHVRPIENCEWKKTDFEQMSAWFNVLSKCTIYKFWFNVQSILYDKNHFHAFTLALATISNRSRPLYIWLVHWTDANYVMNVFRFFLCVRF